MAKKYDPAVELAKGAKLTASSYDKTQKVKVTAGLVTVGGKAGAAEFSGVATGRAADGSIDGTLTLWLAIFRYMRPDGTVNHVAGWNITVSLEKGQTAAQTARAFADYINRGKRPYSAKAVKNKVSITYKE